jgi:SAM-dependent methyltransferase
MSPADRTATSMPEHDLTSPRYWTDEWSAPLGAGRPERGCVWRHPLPSLLARLLHARGAQPTDVLEVGCAPGTILSQLFMLRPQDQYHGVDFSQFGLMQTRRFLARRRIRATLHCCDVREFEPETRYGLVYSCGLIEHFTDPAVVVKHHLRLCAPGGFVAVSVPNYSGFLQQWLINKLDPEALKTHNVQIMCPGALRRVLAEVGLREIVTGCDGPPLLRSRTSGRSLRTHALRRAAQMWNLINSIGPRITLRGSVVWAYGRAT